MDSSGTSTVDHWRVFALHKMRAGWLAENLLQSVEGAFFTNLVTFLYQETF
jgi:hypothetical protein